MDKRADITEADLRAIATKIKAKFNSESEQQWKKGKVMCSYSDWSNGYQLQILCRTASDAKSLVNKILDIQGHSPKWENFQTNTNELPSQAFPTVPEQERILGETVRLDRRRPVATVHFKYAFAQIPGLKNKIILADRSGCFPNPLIEWN
ncbi:MAG: hypothetical protein AAGD25_33785 [Cyanobacteria bacterium P01_F01_bin.150]